MRRFKIRWYNVTQEHQVLGLMLLLGLILGLIFIYIVPPWQHYDEPTHFEYSWLIANRPGLPSIEDFDPEMRREVAASMIESDFFRDLGFTPNLLLTRKPIWIGIPQGGDMPIYYWIAALPLRILGFADVEFQLYANRFISLLLYFVTIVVAYGIAVELTPEKHPLRWLLPFSVLMLPSLVDIMTAANNDVGAVAFFSLFLWTGIRLILKGFNWLRLTAIIILAAICLFTKNTVTIAILLFPIPILFSILRGSQRKYVWITLVIGFFVLVFSMVAWRDAAYWYRVSSPDQSIRTIDSRTHIGDNVLRLNLTPHLPDPGIAQLILQSNDSKLNNSKFTLGSWIWADSPISVSTPKLMVDDELYFKEVRVGTEPSFYSFTGEIGLSNSPLRIIISPNDSPIEQENTVYYDGIVLTDGTWPQDESPEFIDSNGVEGVWGGKPFDNLVRNPSAERSWPWIRLWFDRLLLNRFPVKPSLVLGFLLDPAPNLGYYQAMVKSLTQSFWAKFGWSHVVLRGYRSYTFLGLITVSGIVGSFVAFWRKRDRIPWDVVFFLGIASLVLWGSTMIRGLSSVLGGNYFVPVARYAYPAIIPTMLLLNIGWLEVIRGLEKYLKLPLRISYALLVVFFFVLNGISLFSIHRFFSM